MKEITIERLISDAKKSLNVSPKAAFLYEQNKEQMLEYVNKKLTEHEKITQLIGKNPLEMMYNNHKHHIDFMINVFKLNNYEMLIRIIPWVFKSYHSHGFSYDYFVVVLETWKKAINKYLPKIEADEINTVYEWILKNHENMIHLSKKERLLLSKVSPEWIEIQKKFLSLLLQGDFESCIKLADEVVKSINDIKNFYIEVLQPSLYDVGNLWEVGKISVAEEHLASAIVNRIIAHLYTKFTKQKTRKGKVLITSTPNEFHEIGSRMVADLLELEGWEVFYLGANTPKEDVFTMAKKIRPKVIGISVSMPFNIDKAKDIIEQLRKDKDLKKIKVLVGGTAFNSFPELWRLIGADGWAQNAREAVELLTQWEYDK